MGKNNTDRQAMNLNTSADEIVGWRLSFRARCEVAAIVIALLAFGMLCLLGGKPVTWPGDSFSDMHVLMSGENFAEHGFWRLRFMPIHYTGGMGELPRYYLHYPSLPYVMNGLLRVAGIESLRAMRAFSSLIMVIGLYCMYRAFVRVVGPLAAVCGLAFMGTSSYLVIFGMSLHTHAYSYLFLGLFLLMFLRAARCQYRGLWWWIGCWAVLLASSQTSY